MFKDEEYAYVLEENIDSHVRAKCPLKDACELEEVYVHDVDWAKYADGSYTVCSKTATSCAQEGNCPMIERREEIARQETADMSPHLLIFTELMN